MHHEYTHVLNSPIYIKRVTKLSKSELTKVVAEKAEYTQKNVAARTQTVLDTLTNVLANGEKVYILGFGTVEVCKNLHV